MRFAWEFLWRAFQSTMDFLDTPVRVVILTFCLIAVVAGIELFLKVRKAGAREGLRELLRSWKENLTIATVVVVIAYILLFAFNLFYVVPNEVWREAANTQLPAPLIAVPPSVPTELLRKARVEPLRPKLVPPDEAIRLIPKIAEDVDTIKRQTAPQQPRTIPPEMWRLLLTNLSYSPSRARVEVHYGDDEAYEYASQFFGILKQAGWVLELDRIQVFLAPSARPVRGVLVRVEDKNYRPAILLLQALLDAGIDARGEEVRGLGKGLVVVQVGRR